MVAAVAFRARRSFLSSGSAVALTAKRYSTSPAACRVAEIVGTSHSKTGGIFALSSSAANITVFAAVSRSATHSMAKPNQLGIRLIAGLGVAGDAHSGATVKHRLRVARDAEGLLALAKAHPPGGVLVDLNQPDLDLTALLAALREACPGMPRVVAYGSHVEAATLHAARVAGCDLVLPRSKFAEELPTALPAWVGGKKAD